MELAARQYNRFSRAQLEERGFPARTISRRVADGRWVAVHEAVFAIAPALDDERARWMAATLTEEGTVLSRASAGAAWGWWSAPRDFEVVTRPGSGGPRRIDGVLVYRSRTLAEDTVKRYGIPITTAPRTLLDLAPGLSDRLLARCVREALRLRTTTAAEIVDALGGRHRGRRGSRRLALAVERYTGLPVARARSGAEVVALEVLRDAGRPAPRLNARIAGEEADLSWPRERLIIEVDGGPFHLDAGEDARKDEIWTSAGYVVHRIPSSDVYDDPERLPALAPERP